MRNYIPIILSGVEKIYFGNIQVISYISKKILDIPTVRLSTPFLDKWLL